MTKPSLDDIPTVSNSVSENDSYLDYFPDSPESDVCTRFETIETGVDAKSVLVTKGARYALLKTVATHTPDIYRFGPKSVKNRAKYCMRYLVGDSAEIREQIKNDLPTGLHRWGAVQVCGDIHQCSFCTGIKRARRAAVIQSLINRHLKANGSVLLLTLTVPHTSADSLTDTIGGLSASVDSFWQARGTKSLLSNHGFIGSVRNLEITYGDENGWHPHTHILLFLEDEVSNAVLESELYPVWRRFVEKRMGRIPSKEHGLDVIQGESAADYIAKAGISASKDLAKEVTHAHTKLAKGARLTPFGILARLEEPVDRDKWFGLWCEYCVATQGRHAIGRFETLKKFFGLEPDDEERIASAGAVSVLKTLVAKPVYDQLYSRGLLGDALSIFNGGGNLADLFQLLKGN